MNISKVDLNLLVYFDALLRERSVTKAAHQLSITQPAMSNGLKRLRDLFDDPVLVRTSEGMTPTKRALELQPLVRDILSKLEGALQPEMHFDAAHSDRTFRIMASDYAESTLLPKVIHQLSSQAPQIVLDVMTPSDVTFHDVEHGKVDIAINRFEQLPQSFHQKALWQDEFACVMSVDNPLASRFDLDAYLAAQHIWVSKTGFGVGVGIDPNEVQKLGWVDSALNRLGQKRQIRVFTRHYHVALQLAREQHLIATLPSRAARLFAHDPALRIIAPPFAIPPITLKMAWSGLLQHDAGHIWLRRLIMDIASTL